MEMRSLTRQRGLSLTELLVGSVIGLLIMGSAIAAFVANQHTALTKTKLDDAQEAYRFASHTLSRLVRNATSIASGSSASRLIVELKRAAGNPDCLGNETAGDVTNTFSLSGQALTCDDTVMVRGIETLTFTYGGEGDPEDYTDTPPDWNAITSVYVTLGTEQGLSSAFVATSRAKVLALYEPD